MNISERGHSHCPAPQASQSSSSPPQPSASCLQQQQYPFNSPLSGYTRVSRYQKGKTNLDFTEASDSEYRYRYRYLLTVCGLEAEQLDKTRSLKTSKQHTHIINLWAKRRVKPTSCYGVVCGNDLKRN